MMAQCNNTIGSLSRELIIQTDSNGVIVEMSKNCYNILGYKIEELINRNIDDFIFKKLDINLINKCDRHIQDEIIFRKKDGSKLYMDSKIYAYKEQNKMIKVFISMIDITKQKEKEINNNRILKIFEKSKDVIYSLRIKPKLEIVYVSPGVKDMLGYNPEEYYKNPKLIYQILYSKDKYVKYNIADNKLDYEKPIVVRNIHRDGYNIWTENYAAPIYDEVGDIIGFNGVVRNIQDRKELEDKLFYLSYHDALTGLYNRGYFEKIKEKLDKDKDIAFGIIIIDLDNLKITNDTFGHDIGDRLIKITSSLIKNVVDENATIARFGGDEFIILLENVDYNKVKNTVEKLDFMIKDYNYNNHLPMVEASIGFAYNDKSKGMVENVFRIADKNMYKDKRKKVKESS